MALVERWRPKTHTSHMSHGEVTITLQDVEVIFEFPIDGVAVVSNTTLNWRELCWDFLGFNVLKDNMMVLQGQRILIKLLLEQVVVVLPPNAEEVQLHNYAWCYILALLGDTIFMDKSDNRM
ncbi:serine/threonine-protein phosphatase 7 long form homolog [Castanea sativa]|uniref:serine/threonine-protein phosphatase 7 long form homolog n=1 Tax=Castanea sativa TaxID=21020 RepID=UPI003F64BFD7